MKIISALILLRLSGLKEEEVTVQKIKSLLLKLGDLKADDEWIQLVLDALSGDHLRQVMLQGLSQVTHIDFDLEKLKEADQKKKEEKEKAEKKKQEEERQQNQPPAEAEPEEPLAEEEVEEQNAAINNLFGGSEEEEEEEEEE